VQGRCDASGLHDVTVVCSRQNEVRSAVRVLVLELHPFYLPCDYDCSATSFMICLWSLCHEMKAMCFA